MMTTGGEQPSAFFRQRQFQPNRRTATNITFDIQRAAVFANNPLHNHQPETGPFGFRGEIRFKNPADMFRRDTMTGIHKRHRHIVCVRLGANSQDSAGAHRLQRILNQIVKRLLQLRPVRQTLRQAIRQFQFDQNIPVFNLALQQRQRFHHDIIDTGAL